MACVYLCVYYTGDIFVGPQGLARLLRSRTARSAVPASLALAQIESSTGAFSRCPRPHGFKSPQQTKNGTPQTRVPFFVGPLGLEPRTSGLKVRCSAIELEAPARRTEGTQSTNKPE